ncbi:MAG: c-type cytochrome biogenesis protein CcsB [Desulfobacterales bacterium]|nr:MAG: c-type cytochrome biogenesis protein CcsB [Desulfobacterales bacterium]
MSSSILLSIDTFVYGLASVLYAAAWIFRKEPWGKAASAVALLGMAANFAGIALRWIESHRMGIGHAPLSNLYESLVFFSWAIVIIHLVLESRVKNRVFGVFIMPLAFLSLAYASLAPDISDRIQPLVPALRSNWLIAHVVTCFLGYAGFSVAFGISIMYLIQAEKGREHPLVLVRRFPDASDLDDLTHKMIQFGFLFLSLGIITGAVWADSAWGRYWGWDPKETWSLITWFIYATFLHARLMRGWQGKRIAVFSIIGFIAVMFTYFGVNFLLTGLHSYGVK